MRKCSVLWRAQKAAKASAAASTAADATPRKIRSYYDTLRDDGTRSVTDVLDLPDAPTDMGRIYSDWASQHKVTDEMLLAVLDCALRRIEASGDAAEQHDERLQLLRQAAELYVFANDDMLVVPATAGVRLTECCIAADRQGPAGTVVGLRTATALYAKLREEKEANQYTTRFCPAFLAAMLRFRCDKTTQRVFADSEKLDVKLPIDAVELDEGSQHLETCLQNPVFTAEASLTLLCRLATKKSQTAPVLPLLLKIRKELAADPHGQLPPVKRVHELPTYVLARCGREALGILRDVLQTCSAPERGGKSRCGPVAHVCEKMLTSEQDPSSKEGQRRRAYPAIAQGQFGVAATLLADELWFEGKVRDVFSSEQPEPQVRALVLDEQAMRLVPLQALNALADFLSKRVIDAKAMRALSERVLQRDGAFSDTALLKYFTLVSRETDVADATKELLAHARNSVVQPSAAYNGAIAALRRSTEPAAAELCSALEAHVGTLRCVDLATPSRA